MSNMRRLQEAVAVFHQHRRTLIFVDDLYPAIHAEDHLERNIMVMHVIRDRAALRDTDVRGYKLATKSARYQVTIFHAGPARAKPFVSQSGNCEFGISRLDRRTSR